MEIWKEIPRYSGVYEVSSHGNVRSLDRWITSKAGWRRFHKGKRLSPGICGGGYAFVNLYKDKKVRHESIHRLVAEAFIGIAEDGKDVHHINHIKTDNHLENLVYATRSENIRESYKREGRKRNNEKWKGEYVNTSKLTDESVREIKLIKGSVYQTDIAEMYSVSVSTIKRIHQGRSWTHIN